jgi:small-conductance mechanosensitive channel
VRIIVLDRRPTEARLLQDLMVAVVYVGVALSILAFVFGAPIGTLVATSGVVAVILGLALQNTLGDVFSGIALTLGRPFGIGDWIQLGDGTEGRVVENNWRSTQLLTAAHNVVVLPNSVLAKVGLTNLTRPDETHLIALTVRIASIHQPSLVGDVMKSVLESCGSIVRQGPAVVALKSIDAAAIEVELQFRVADPAHRTAARNEVIDLIHQRCRKNGLLLAMPPQSYFCALPSATGDTGIVAISDVRSTGAV